MSLWVDQLKLRFQKRPVMPQPDDLLPYFCKTKGIFGLIVASELIAIGIVLIKHSLWPFPWGSLGVISLVVLWVSLSAAAVLCSVRRFLRQLRPLIGGLVAYSLVLGVAAFILGFGRLFFLGHFDALIWLRDVVVAAIFSGIWMRYFYLQQQLRYQQQSELQARIQALQARIRPHFLFNSMNTIASLVSIDPDAAEQVVEDLSELFRASLQEAGLVSLEEELALCRSYVAIEQTRLGQRLGVQWQCDIDTKKFSIPRLSLQPLIENAIYHGISGLRGGGVVEVVLRDTESDVFIQVRNPFPTELTYDKTEESHQVAMENITHRLQAYYGNRASLLVQIQTGDTVQDFYVVTIRLPREREPDSVMSM